MEGHERKINVEQQLYIMSKKTETYERKAIFAELKEFCHIAKDDGFIEVVEWKNGDGWDVTIDNRVFSLTHGELTAINTLTNLL